MSETAQLVLFCLVALIVAGTQVALIVWAAKRNAGKPSVYRRVVNETDQTVTLECGHSYAVIRHKRESFPCAACALAIRATNLEPARETAAIEGKDGEA